MSKPQVDYVGMWLDSVYRENSGSESTLTLYRLMFDKFLQFLGKTAEDIVSDYENSENEQKTRREYGRLVRAFASHLQHNNDYAPSTIAQHIATVKSFFSYSDLLLPKIRLGRKIVRYSNRDIEKKEILAILRNTKFPRDRAFFLTMAQSGLRPHELCNLKMADVEHSMDQTEQESYKIQVPQQAAKGKYRAYFTFIPAEAMKALRDYWQTRTDPLTEASYVFTIERGETIRPTTGGAMTQAFRKILLKLERTGVLSFELRKGKPSQLRLYSLRKWFRKQAFKAGSDFVNFWMGHTNLDLEHYFSKDPNVHRKVFEDKAAPDLKLETHTRTETDKLILSQAKEIQELKRTRDGVEKRVEAIENLVKDLILKLEQGKAQT